MPKMILQPDMAKEGCQLLKELGQKLKFQKEKKNDTTRIRSPLFGPEIRMFFGVLKVRKHAQLAHWDLSFNLSHGGLKLIT